MRGKGRSKDGQLPKSWKKKSEWEKKKNKHVGWPVELGSRKRCNGIKTRNTTERTNYGKSARGFRRKTKTNGITIARYVIITSDYLHGAYRVSGGENFRTLWRVQVENPFSVFSSTSRIVGESCAYPCLNNYGKRIQFFSRVLIRGIFPSIRKHLKFRLKYFAWNSAASEKKKLAITFLTVDHFLILTIFS